MAVAAVNNDVVVVAAAVCRYNLQMLTVISCDAITIERPSRFRKGDNRFSFNMHYNEPFEFSCIFFTGSVSIAPKTHIHNKIMER